MAPSNSSKQSVSIWARSPALSSHGAEQRGSNHNHTHSGSLGWRSWVFVVDSNTLTLCSRERNCHYLLSSLTTLERSADRRQSVPHLTRHTEMPETHGGLLPTDQRAERQEDGDNFESIRDSRGLLWKASTLAPSHLESRQRKEQQRRLNIFQSH